MLLSGVIPSRCGLSDVFRYIPPVELVVVVLPRVNVEEIDRPFQRLPSPTEAPDVVTDKVLRCDCAGCRRLSGSCRMGAQIQRLDRLGISLKLTGKGAYVTRQKIVYLRLTFAGRRRGKRNELVFRWYIRCSVPAA
ncbi:hypothetical protein [Paenibacillus larvae]|uniref:hypothetical protein n=1 Tax=Paenibacillus larvae TaxID=1464 RepID=UPI002853B625|nr:hypothetical protein [Paenibacillus larvae]MDR5605434.1 hypothetical protein [Paenibacillus larvae]